MYNFDRLLGTDLLMAQFESFVRDWFVTPGTREPRERYQLDPRLPHIDGAVAAYDDLPDVMRRFYELDDQLEMIQDWPLVYPLHVPVRYPKGADAFPASEDHICIMQAKQGEWTISIAPDEDGIWQPYYSEVANHEWQPLPIPLQEMLVSYALREITFVGAIGLREPPYDEEFLTKPVTFLGRSPEQDNALKAYENSQTSPIHLFTSRFDPWREYELKSREPVDFHPIEYWYHHETGLLFSWRTGNRTFEMVARGERGARRGFRPRHP